jgi:hypothetical protein
MEAKRRAVDDLSGVEFEPGWAQNRAQFFGRYGIGDRRSVQYSPFNRYFGQLIPFMAVRQRVVRVVGATLEQAKNGTELVSATVATTESGISSF